MVSCSFLSISGRLVSLEIELLRFVQTVWSWLIPNGPHDGIASDTTSLKSSRTSALLSKMTVATSGKRQLTKPGRPTDPSGSEPAREGGVPVTSAPPSLAFRANPTMEPSKSVGRIFFFA